MITRQSQDFKTFLYDFTRAYFCLYTQSLFVKQFIIIFGLTFTYHACMLNISF